MRELQAIQDKGGDEAAIAADQLTFLRDKGAEALRRLTEAPLNEQQKFLLADCVEAYLPLDEERRREY